MTFEEFHHMNPQYTYLIAKIHYNILQDRENTTSTKHLLDKEDTICENCSS